MSLAPRRDDGLTRRGDRPGVVCRSRLPASYAVPFCESRTKTEGGEAFSVDPGGVAPTNFVRNNGMVPWIRHLAAHALRHELVSPRKGVETGLLALSGAISHAPPAS